MPSLEREEKTLADSLSKLSKEIYDSEKAHLLLRKELLALADNSEGLLKSFIEAKTDIDLFSSKLKETFPNLATMGKIGAKGTGEALGDYAGRSVAGSIGGAVGGLAGGAAVSLLGSAASELGSAIEKSFDNGMNSVRTGLENTIKTGLMAGFEGAANLMKNRQGAAQELESELGLAAAFMGQDQIQQVWKQKKMMADIRTQGQFNVQQAIADEGSIGFMSSVSNLWQGALSTVGLGTNPASNSADQYITNSSKSLNNASRSLERTFYGR